MSYNFTRGFVRMGNFVSDLKEGTYLRRRFGQKWMERYEVWREMNNEELHNFYFSPNIIIMIKTRTMQWAGHVERVGGRGMHVGFW
jgi:hypothetical protein